MHIIYNILYYFHQLQHLNQMMTFIKPNMINNVIFIYLNNIYYSYNNNNYYVKDVIH